ncbi:MAG: hypothetical protein ACREOG_16205, partial [Gemmatimonadaceae bacterium]
MGRIPGRGTRWRRTLALIVLLGLPGAAPLAQPFRARVRLPGYPTVIALDTLAVRIELPASRGEVFQVTAAAFEVELKIDTKVRDSTAGLVGNMELVKMRTLGRAPLSRYVSCGSGMTGPNADSYRIHLAIMAFVDSLAPQRTRL